MNKLAMPPYDWQAAAWQSFVRQVASRKLPHAILVNGPEGVGLEKFGRAMAQYLLCKSPIESSACGTCKSCHLIAAGSHSDLFELVPAEKGKAILVDQIRELTEFVGKTAQHGGRKLVFVEPADAMNVNAANSLLKCLEEPAGDTVIILVTSALSRLMPTIRSRCAKIELAQPAPEVSLAWLQSLGVKDAQLLLDEIGNAPLLALDWSQNETFLQYQSMCEELAALSQGTMTVSVVSKKWSAYGAMVCINRLLRWLDKLITSRYLDVGSATEEWQALARATATVPETLMFRYRDALCMRKSQLQDSAYLNATLLVEELLLDWKTMLTVSQRAAFRKISL